MEEKKSILRKYLDWRKVTKQKKEKNKPQTFSEIALSWIKTILGAIIVVMIINGLAIASFVVPTGSMENTVMTGDFLFVNKFIYGPSTPQVVPFFNIPLPFYKFPAFREPKKGDVIVFIYPGDRDEVKAKEFQYYLKRCVAVSGDTLMVKNMQLYINGKKSKNPKYSKFIDVPMPPYDKYRTFPVGKGYTRDNYGPIRIPKKGDIINLTINNFKEWDIFIQREGHKTEFDGRNIYIDGNKTNQYKVERDYCFGMGDNRNNSEDSRYWGFIPIENVVGTPIVVYWSWKTNLPIARLMDKLASVKWSRIGTFIN